MARNNAQSLVRRDLASSMGDGTAYSVMVGVGETYVPAFALALGLSGVETGLLASVPLVVGALLQLVSPRAIAWSGSIRRWVVACAVAQALAFLPLLVGAVLGRLPTGVLFLSMALYWGAGLATGPAWTTWIETLVPRSLRATYFARRSRFAHAAVLAGFLAGGALLSGGEQFGMPLTAFAALFVIAALSRLVSAGFLIRHREPVTPEVERIPLRGLAARVRSGPAGTLLVYMIALQVSVYLAAPFFTPYMLRSLRLSYVDYTLLTAAAFVSRVVVFPLLGRAARRLGALRLLFLAGIGIAPLAVLWTLSDSFAYLLVLQLLGGAAWAAYELATILLFFETLPRARRVSILTLFNLANASAMVVGSLVGAGLLAGMGESRGSYGVLFAVSSGLRLSAMLVLLRLPALRLPALRMAERLPLLRTVAVRPGVGAIQRPLVISESAPSVPGE